MKVKDWLWFFLKSDGREMIGPDGRPLFAYQMSKAEFDDLGRFLSSCMESRAGRVGFAHQTSRVFVLYGAEWWRRNFNGGQWKWELITNSIGWQGVDQKYLAPMVVEGMQYWQRDILRYRTGNAYLTTIVLEGGIPLLLLQQQGASFTRYLKAVIGEHAKWSGAGMSAHSHAVNCQRLLTAKSLRKEQIFQLAATIVEVIYALSADLESKTDPFNELNAKHPGWQRQLPMAIEDEGAKNLVDALIKEAQKKRSSKYDRFLINRYLTEFDNHWEQRASLEVPDVIPAEVLAEQLNIRVDDLPSRLELIARTDTFTLKVASLMRVQRDQDEYSVSFYRRDKLSFELPFSEAITCTLQSAGDPVGDYTVEGAEAVDVDLPMLFVHDEAHGYRLLGGGSISSRVDSGRLILPPGAVVQQGEADCVESSLSTIDFFTGRDIFDVKGELLVRLKDDFICRIRLSATRDSSTHYSLSGKRLYALEQKFLPVFTGLPDLIAPKGGVKPNKIIWRSEYRGAEWHDVSKASPLGCVRLRALHDNECLFAAKLVVLPQDFSYAISRSESLSEGTLLLHGIKGADVTYTGNNAMNVVVENEKDLSIVACQGSEVAGGRFPLNLGWPNGKYCVLDMPFPGKGSRFTNIERGTICGRRISIVDLLMVSAQAVSPQAGTGYKLVAELRAVDVDKAISRSSMYFERAMPRVSDGFYELPLVDLYSPIKELFSYSADLDASVRLEIICGGRQDVVLDVVQFDSELSFDPSSAIVAHQSYSSENSGDSILKFLPFNHEDTVEELAQEMAVSECTDDTRWMLKDRELTSSGLVIADGQLGRLVRPCVMYVNDGSLETSTLEPAIQYIEDEPEDIERESTVELTDVWHLPSFSARRKEFSDIFSLLPESPDHDDWSTLVQYVERFKEAHPDCLDAHEVLIDSPGAILGVIFRSQPEVVDIIMEWEEYIPLRLWMIPAKFWHEALNGYLSYLEKFDDFIIDLEKENLINILMQIKLREPNTVLIVNQLLSVLGSHQDETDYDKAYGLSEGLPAYMGGIQRHVATTMFGRPDDERWPAGIDREIWNTINKNPLWLEPGAGYRRAFLDAPIYAAFTVAKGEYLQRNHRAFVAAIRNFDGQSFDDLFLKFLVVFLKLIK
jgi:hypothetical protein